MRTNWILNKDRSIYHLKLKPGDLSPIILTVGDPDRVQLIGNYFKDIETNIQSREFKTITGYLNGKRISVMSTGIGTGNIDIVINEVDALFNIDLETGLAKDKIEKLSFIRLGTSGAIQKDIPVDSLLTSSWCVGMEGLLPYYAKASQSKELPAFLAKDLPGLSKYFVWNVDIELFEKINTKDILSGCTLTASGFYAPQGRNTRVHSVDYLKAFQQWNVENIGRIVNLEMETSAIYGLSRVLGHRALSISAILANRITGEFSNNPDKCIKRLIEHVLDKISGLGS